MKLYLPVEVGFSMLRSRTRMALGALLLLAAALSTAGTILVLALPQAMDRTSSAYERRYPFSDPDAPVIGYAIELATLLDQDDFTIVLVAYVADGPTPPGVGTLPAPGTAVVSPAVRRRLESRGEVVAARIHSARVVGEVSAEGLRFPDELLAYVGVEHSDARPTLDPITQWGVPSGIELEQRAVPSHVWVLVSLALLIPVFAVFRTVLRQIWLSNRRLADALTTAGDKGHRLLAASVRWQIVPFATSGVVLGIPLARVLWPAVQALPWRYPPDFPDVDASVWGTAVVLTMGALWSVWRLGFEEQADRHRDRPRITFIAGVAALGSAIALAGVTGRRPVAALGFFGASIALLVSVGIVLQWIDRAMSKVLPRKASVWWEYSLSPSTRFGEDRSPLLSNLMLAATWLATFGSGVASVFAVATTVNSGVTEPVAPGVAFAMVDRASASELARHVDQIYPIDRWGDEGIAELPCGAYQLLVGSQQLDCASTVVVFGANDPAVRQVADALQLAFPASDIRRVDSEQGSPTLPVELSGSSESVWISGDLPIDTFLGPADQDPVISAVIQTDQSIDEIRNAALTLGGYTFSDDVGPIGNLARAEDVNRVATRMISITRQTAIVLSLYVQVFLVLAFSVASWAHLREAPHLRGLELVGADRETIFSAALVTVGLPLGIRLLAGVGIGAYAGAMYARFTGYSSEMSWPLTSLLALGCGFLLVTLSVALARSRANSLAS